MARRNKLTLLDTIANKHLKSEPLSGYEVEHLRIKCEFIKAATRMAYSRLITYLNEGITQDESQGFKNATLSKFVNRKILKLDKLSPKVIEVFNIKASELLTPDENNLLTKIMSENYVSDSPSHMMFFEGDDNVVLTDLNLTDSMKKIIQSDPELQKNLVERFEGIVRIEIETYLARRLSGHNKPTKRDVNSKELG